MASTTSFKFFRTDSQGNIVGGAGGGGGGISANNFLTGASFDNTTGVATFTRQGLDDITLTLNHTLDYVTGVGNTTTNSITVGSAVINGNLTVNGTQFITNTETVQIEDNLLIINNGEVASGVAGGTGVAGIEVDRGLATNYQFLFDDNSDEFKIGEIGSLQPVATRVDSPTNGHYAKWDDANNRLEFVAESTITAGDSDKLGGFAASAYIRSVQLSPVATSGNYSDLVGVPELVVSVGANSEDVLASGNQALTFDAGSDIGLAYDLSTNTITISNTFTETAQTLSFLAGELTLTDGGSAIDLDARYYTESEVDSLIAAVDTYSGWNLAATTGGSTLINETETVTFIDGLNTTATRVGNTITIDVGVIDGGDADTLNGLNSSAFWRENYSSPLSIGATAVNHDNALTTFGYSGSGGSNRPTNTNGHYFAMSLSSAYTWTMFNPYNSNRVFTRTQDGGVWKSWNELITEENFNSFFDGRVSYPTDFVSKANGGTFESPVRFNGNAIYIGESPQLTIEKFGGNFRILQSGSGYGGTEIQLSRAGETTRVMGDFIVDEGATINGTALIQDTANNLLTVRGLTTNAFPTILLDNNSLGGFSIVGDYGGTNHMSIRNEANDRVIRFYENSIVNEVNTQINGTLDVTDGLGGDIRIGTNTTAVKTLMFGSNNDYSIQSNGGSYLRFHTEGAEQMRITSSGNVGIGTSNPSATLDVNGNVRLSGDLSFTNGEITSDNNNTGARVIARAINNPDADRAIFAVESSGSATRFGVTQSNGAWARDSLWVGYSYNDGVVPTPSYILDVNGDASISGNLTRAGNTVVDAGNFGTYFDNRLNVLGNVAKTDVDNNFIASQTINGNLSLTGDLVLENGENIRYGGDRFLLYNGNTFLGDIDNRGGVLYLRSQGQNVISAISTKVEVEVDFQASGNSTFASSARFNSYADFDRGIHGGYATVTGSGTDWGQPIWSIGQSYDGSGEGSSYVTAGQYGMSWLRGAHGQANSNIGEGLYIYVNGNLQGGLGTRGLYVNDNAVFTQSVTIEGNTAVHGGNFASFLSVQGNIAKTDEDNSFITNQTFNVSATIDGLLLNDSDNRYGLLEVHRKGSAGWTGYSIDHDGQHWSLMGKASDFGIYDDTNNEWILRYDENSKLALYHNGSAKLETASNGVDITGTLTASSFIGDGSNLTNIVAEDALKLDGVLGSDYARKAINNNFSTTQNITGNLDITGNLLSDGYLITDNPTGRTAEDWKFGDVGTVSNEGFDGTVLYVQVNGTVYKLMCAEITPI